MSPQAEDHPIEQQIPATLHTHEWIQVGDCPLCGSGHQAHRHFERLETDDRPLDYWLCGRCGVVFQSPRLGDRSLEEYYEEIYHQHMMPEDEDVARNEWVLEQRAGHLAAFAREHIREVSNLLDVGSSRGHVLDAFKGQYNAEAYAVEPGAEVKVDVARHARHVVAELEQLPERLGGQVDLAVLSHVLEHFAYPRDFLARLRQEWLHPEAWLLVEVPNLMWHSALELSHLTAYTAASLREMIEAAGYQLTHLRLHGRPYSHRFPLFILALARPSDEPGLVPQYSKSAPAWWLRWRRRFNRALYRTVQLSLRLVHGVRRFQPWAE